MRFRLLTAVLTTVALAAAASAAGAGAPPASVKVASCSVAQHSAAFYARMKLVDGADRMALRFTLLVRTGLEGDKAVKAPGLRRWHRSKPGVVSLRYRQAVRNLGENASYRAQGRLPLVLVIRRGGAPRAAALRSLPAVRGAPEPRGEAHRCPPGEGARV